MRQTGSDRRRRLSATSFSEAMQSMKIMLPSRNRSSAQPVVLNSQLLMVFIIVLLILYRFWFPRPFKLGFGTLYRAVSEMRILEFPEENK